MSLLGFLKNVHPKVKGAAGVGAVIAALISLLASLGIQMPDSAASALTVLATSLAGWIMPANDAHQDDITGVDAAGQNA